MRAGLIVLGLLLLSGATHFIGLGYPREVIFDEVHFGKFITAYCCTGERFFDIHPPHAKLLIAAVAKLSGYQGDFPFEHIGQPYGAVSPLGFRLVSAATGTILPLVLYILVRQLGGSRAAAAFGALLVIFDNALTIQTRVMALDGLLLLGTFGSLSAYLAAERALREQKLWQWIGWAILAGTLAGLAVGSKFTGLLALGIIGVIGLYRVIISYNKPTLRRWFALGGIILVTAAIVYTAGWVLHFLLLTQPGGGDAWGIPQWDSPLLLSFWRETVALHKTMYNANNGLTIFHHDSSPWWGWPFMSNPVFYWHKPVPGAVSVVQAIYFIGNPVVWMGSTLLLFTAVAWLVIRTVQSATAATLRKSHVLLPLLGYALSFWPLTRVDRGLFLYHYVTPLLFAILVGVLWLDEQGWFGDGSVSHVPRRVYVSLAVVILFFLFFSPLTYGFRLHPDTQALLFWFQSWR